MSSKLFMVKVNLSIFLNKLDIVDLLLLFFTYFALLLIILKGVGT